MNIDTSICESPIEGRVAAMLADMLRDGVQLDLQKKLTAGKHNYRADMFVEAAGRRVVIECDGREFHDFGNDRQRDLNLILDAGIADVVRLRGCDISFALHDVGRFLYYVIPDMLKGNGSRPTLQTMADLAIAAPTRIERSIWRARFAWDEPLTQFPQEKKTFCGIARTPEFAVMQFVAPGWAETFKGPVLMGDVLEFTLGDIAALNAAGAERAQRREQAS